MSFQSPTKDDLRQTSRRLYENIHLARLGLLPHADVHDPGPRITRAVAITIAMKIFIRRVQNPNSKAGEVGLPVELAGLDLRGHGEFAAGEIFAEDGPGRVAIARTRPRADELPLGGAELTRLRGGEADFRRNDGFPRVPEVVPDQVRVGLVRALSRDVQSARPVMISFIDALEGGFGAVFSLRTPS